VAKENRVLVEAARSLTKGLVAKFAYSCGWRDERR
jgi:hypothetical protein